jgi:alkylhydroperoxidase family enzyme
MPDRPLRLAPLPPEDWNQEVQDFFGGVYGPENWRTGTKFNMPLTFVRHPELTKAIFAFSRKVQELAEITPRLREIVIMRVAWHARTDYEWGHHNRYMRDLGMGDEHVEGIKTGPDAPVWSDAERAALRTVDELTLTRELSDETWAALKANYSIRQIIDILVLMGQYAMLTYPFNAVGLRLESEYDALSMDRGQEA